MITVACLTSLVALNGKNHAGTGNSAAFTVTQPLERDQNDAFGPPTVRILSPGCPRTELSTAVEPPAATQLTGRPSSRRCREGLSKALPVEPFE